MTGELIEQKHIGYDCWLKIYKAADDKYSVYRINYLGESTHIDDFETLSGAKEFLEGI